MFIEPHIKGECGGWIEVICGPMFSGKSEEMIRRLRRAEIAGQRVVLVKPRIDDRYDSVDIVSHAGARMRGIAVADIAELTACARGFDVVGIDEIQFFPEDVVAAALGLAAAAAVGYWRTRRFDATGEPHHRVLWGAGVLLAFLVLGYVAFGRPFGVSLPERGELATTGGFRLSPEYAALLIGLVLYTASHIAEIVRGSILAVPRGQTEAANAVALSGFQRLRFVILPQAFRISVPPMANQYLNLTKNSSLGIAIGFYELTRVTRIEIGQGAPAPQATFVLMLFYLCFSLFIALVTNVINRRLEIKAR